MPRWTAAEVAAQIPGSGKSRARKKGDGWMVACPVHNDGRPSLSLSNGRVGLVWHCHAGCSQSDIQKALEDVMGGKQTADRKDAPKARIDRVSVPVRVMVPPTDEAARVRPENFWTQSLDMPSNIWTYRRADGSVMHYVARYNTANGKELLPWSWCQVGASPPVWKPKAMEDKRPLYNLDQLTKRIDDPVLYVEGEKAADAAAKLFPLWVVTTNSGGANALNKADLAPLHGRRVIIMPDADAPGRKMMIELARLLYGNVPAIHELVWPRYWADCNQYEVLPGDDAADHLERGWTTGELRGCVNHGHQLIPMLEHGDDFGAVDSPEFFLQVYDGKATVVQLVDGKKHAIIGVAKGWSQAVEFIEGDFNRRLKASKMLPGRFPRRRGEVKVANHFGLELVALIHEFQGEARIERLDRWMNHSYFRRQKIGTELLAS